MLLDHSPCIPMHLFGIREACVGQPVVAKKFVRLMVQSCDGQWKLLVPLLRGQMPNMRQTGQNGQKHFFFFFFFFLHFLPHHTKLVVGVPHASGQKAKVFKKDSIESISFAEREALHFEIGRATIKELGLAPSPWFVGPAIDGEGFYRHFVALTLSSAPQLLTVESPSNEAIIFGNFISAEVLNTGTMFGALEIQCNWLFLEASLKILQEPSFFLHICLCQKRNLKKPQQEPKKTQPTGYRGYRCKRRQNSPETLGVRAESQKPGRRPPGGMPPAVNIERTSAQLGCFSAFEEKPLFLQDALRFASKLCSPKFSPNLSPKNAKANKFSIGFPLSNNAFVSIWLRTQPEYSWSPCAQPWSKPVPCLCQW